jgi:hypothetical protein
MAALTTTVVGAAPALAQAVSASPPASSTPILPDPLGNVQRLTEAIQASSRSAVVTKRRVIDQLDGGNMSLSSCDTSLHENIPLITLPALPPTQALAMTALPASVLPMMALPVPTPQMAAPPMPRTGLYISLTTHPG